PSAGGLPAKSWGTGMASLASRPQRQGLLAQSPKLPSQRGHDHRLVPCPGPDPPGRPSPCVTNFRKPPWYVERMPGGVGGGNREEPAYPISALVLVAFEELAWILLQRAQEVLKQHVRRTAARCDDLAQHFKEDPLVHSLAVKLPPVLETLGSNCQHFSGQVVQRLSAKGSMECLARHLRAQMGMVFRRPIADQRFGSIQRTIVVK